MADTTEVAQPFAVFDDSSCWVPYKMMPREGNPAKKDKIPSNGKRNLSTADPADWMTMAAAQELVANSKGELKGVGLVMSGGFQLNGASLIGLDFDGVDFDKFEPPFPGYAEKSPSGNGVRMFGWRRTEDVVRFRDSKKVTYPHCKHAEVYFGTSPSFLTITFDQWHHGDIPLIDDAAWQRLVSLDGVKKAGDAAGSADVPDIGDGQAFDLTALHFLNARQRQMVNGEIPEGQRNEVVFGLLVALIDAPARHPLGGIKASVLKNEALLAYFSKHADAAKFADEEIQRAFCASERCRRAKLVSYSPEWAQPEPELPADDSEQQWELANATEPYAAYCAWYMENARLLHPAYAMASADLFFQACAGWNIKTPSGLRANPWLLLLASSAGGKGAIPELATEALRQLMAKGISPSIQFFEDSFSSGQAMWGYIMQTHQAIWFNPELAEALAKIGKAEHGPLAEKLETILKLSDCSTKPNVPPPRYALSTQGRYQLQPVSFGYFSIVGTGVIGDIRAFTDTSSKSGLLNRFLPVVVEGRPVIGNSGGFSPLPDAIVKWAKTTFIKNQATKEAQNRKSQLGNAIEFRTYPEFDADWRAAMEFELDMGEKNVGIYGRYGEKVVKRALLHAFTAGSDITPQGIEWAKRSVQARLAKFADHFDAEGGGAKNAEDAMCRAFMRTFTTPRLSKKHTQQGYLLWSEFQQSGGKAWRECRDPTKLEKTLDYLKLSGFIEELSSQEKDGKGLRGEWRAFRKLRDYV